MRSAKHRIDKFAAKQDPGIIGKRYDATKKTGAALYKSHVINQVQIELSVKSICQDVGVVLLPYYIIYAQELNKHPQHQEREIVFNKWLKRGLFGSKLQEIGLKLFNWQHVPVEHEFYGDTSCRWLRCFLPNYMNTHDSATGSVHIGSIWIYVRQRESAGNYYIYRGAMFFDTSGIPPTAEIVSARLLLYVSNLFTTSPFNLVVQQGLPDYPHDPVVDGDYNHNNWSGNYGQIASGDIAIGAYNEIAFTSPISQIGKTKFVLRVSTDIAAQDPGVAGSEGVFIRGYNTGPGQRPVLAVTY